MQATDDALTAEKNAEIAEIATVAARAAVCCLLIRRIGTKLILKAINRRSIENYDGTLDGDATTGCRA